MKFFETDNSFAPLRGTQVGTSHGVGHSTIPSFHYSIGLFLLVLLISPALPAFSQDIHSLHPRPKSSFERPGQFLLDRSTALIVPNRPAVATVRAVAAIQAFVQTVIGDTLQVIPEASMSGRNAITVGEYNGYPAMTALLAMLVPPGENAPPPQGYVLDITAGNVVLAGADPDGTFNGVSTLRQLASDLGSIGSIRCAHIWDYPDYPIRWVFSQQNLRGANGIGNLRKIADTMALRKLNGFQHTDFKYGILQLQPNYYFDSVRIFKELCDRRNIEIVPGIMNIGYSGQILYTDPNLAEGIPSTVAYVVESDTGRLLPDARALLPNGDFESVSNNQFTGWNFYDGPNVSVFVDKSVFHGGATSARCTNFRQGNASGNARFNRLIQCQPFRAYLLSAWIRTQGFSGDNVQLFAYGQDNQGNYRPLSYTDYSIPATTTGWIRAEVTFNTLSYEKVLLYIGVWGGNAGTIWFDDFQIRDVGLTNVLRRPGAPLTVTNKNSGTAFLEGIDFSPVIDQKMQNGSGSYGPYHQPPTLRRSAAGAIRNGDTLLVTSYHPANVYGDLNGNGSVMVCVSEDTLYRILEDQTARVNALYDPSRFFMGHDEIRNMNWDKSCLDRNLSPAELLADNVSRCAAIVERTHPGAQALVWSDMFDSTHNAHDDYYLVNGDLTGDWDRIPRSLVIANWNGGNADASLKFFADRGFSQITSPYYDVGNSSSIRAWRLAMQNVPNVLGAMYTTWAQDYNFLTAFGDYMWSAGPFVMHTPLDSAAGARDTLRFAAEAFSDGYDASDDIVSVKVEILNAKGNIVAAKDLSPSGIHDYLALLTHKAGEEFRYRIVAVNRQGLRRETPVYIVKGSTPTEVKKERIPSGFVLSIYPNPFSDRTTIQLRMTNDESRMEGKSAIRNPQSAISLKVYDLLGREVLDLTDRARGSDEVTLEGSRLPGGGLFICRMASTAGVESIRLIHMK